MCDCVECEEMLQPYLDRVLTDEEMLEAEEHLAQCSWCRKRYRFEEKLRMYVRLAAHVPIPPDLKLKLRELRTPL